jgi:hypothetical protein
MIDSGASVRLFVAVPPQGCAGRLASSGPAERPRCVWTYLALTVLDHCGFSVKVYAPEPDKPERIVTAASLAGGVRCVRPLPGLRGDRADRGPHPRRGGGARPPGAPAVQGAGPRRASCLLCCSHCPILIVFVYYYVTLYCSRLLSLLSLSMCLLGTTALSQSRTTASGPVWSVRAACRPTQRGSVPCRRTSPPLRTSAASAARTRRAATPGSRRPWRCSRSTGSSSTSARASTSSTVGAMGAFNTTISILDTAY